MKVSEVIELLKEMPGTAELYYYDEDSPKHPRIVDSFTRTKINNKKAVIINYPYYNDKMQTL